MIYLTTPSTPLVRDAMRSDPQLGAMLNPVDRKIPEKLAGIPCAIDNGCFAEQWRPARWLAALERWLALDPALVMFAVVPDVVADPVGTAARWREWSPLVREMGYRVAYVAQDGLDLGTIPWDEIDVWFTGGTTEWKMSLPAWAAMRAAHERGKHCHLGRVNGITRLRAGRDGGYDSADGTFLRYGPNVNLLRVNAWFDLLDSEPHLGLIG